MLRVGGATVEVAFVIVRVLRGTRSVTAVLIAVLTAVLTAVVTTVLIAVVHDRISVVRSCG